MWRYIKYLWWLGVAVFTLPSMVMASVKPSIETLLQRSDLVVIGRLQHIEPALSEKASASSGQQKRQKQPQLHITIACDRYLAKHTGVSIPSDKVYSDNVAPPFSFSYQAKGKNRIDFYKLWQKQQAISENNSQTTAHQSNQIFFLRLSANVAHKNKASSVVDAQWQLSDNWFAVSALSAQQLQHITMAAMDQAGWSKAFIACD